MKAQTPYPSLQTTKYMNTISKSIWTLFSKKKKKKKYMSTTFFTNRIIKKKKITAVNIVNYD